MLLCLKIILSSNLLEPSEAEEFDDPDITNDAIGAMFGPDVVLPQLSRRIPGQVMLCRIDPSWLSESGSGLLEEGSIAL